MVCGNELASIHLEFLKKYHILVFALVDCVYRFPVNHRAELCEPLDFLDFLAISVVLCWVMLLYTWIGYPLILIMVTHGRLPYETSREKNESVDVEQKTLSAWADDPNCDESTVLKLTEAR